MLKKFVVLAVLLCSTALMAFPRHGMLPDGEKYTYEGVKVCGMCHKSEKSGNQLGIWQKSAHSKAYETLKSAEANKIAQAKYGKNAIDVPECLSCHVTGHGMDASMLGSKFSMEDGVQCETCHGPGSAYKSMKIMKDRKEAVKNGLKVYDKPAELCVTCHNDKSPTFKSFDFDKMWAKIKHDVPKQ